MMKAMMMAKLKSMPKKFKQEELLAQTKAEAKWIISQKSDFELASVSELHLV